MKINTIRDFGTILAFELRKSNRTRTAETYEASLRSFIRFRNGKDLPLSRLSQNVILEYQGWLQQKGLRPGSVSFYMRVLRAIYNQAVERNIISDCRPFRKAYTGIPSTVHRALTLEELKRLAGLRLIFNTGSMAFALDMFIMSFYLRGMNLSDLARLKWTDIRKDRLCYRRRKTGKLLSMEWTVEMKEIAQKYNRVSSPYLFPLLSDSETINTRFRTMTQRINRTLHQISKILGIRNGNVTFYCARHTWATVARNAGTPVSVISDALGHSSEAVTRIYLDSIDGTTIDKVNRKLINMINSRR